MSVVKSIARALVSNRLTWPLISFMHRITNRFVFEKEQMAKDRRSADFKAKNKVMFARLFSDCVVKQGPFKGMKHLGCTPRVNRVIPKVLGCYEIELQDWINRLKSRDYSDVINVGTAEGYYTVGFACMFPNAKIIGYEIQDYLLGLTKKMAELNNVSNRIELRKELCTDKTLAEYDFSRRGLVFSDCEGYELELFTKENVSNLKKCDLIIEIHDFIDLKISSHLFEVFSDTHDIELVASQNPYLIAKKHPELEGMSDEELMHCVPWRRKINQWMLATCRQ